MKKVFFLLLLISATVSFSQTDVSGTISSDTTWGTSGSPYNVTNSVLVATGVTLTIEAGRLDQLSPLVKVKRRLVGMDRILIVETHLVTRFM